MLKAQKEIKDYWIKFRRGCKWLKKLKDEIVGAFFILCSLLFLFFVLFYCLFVNLNIGIWVDTWIVLI